MERGIMRVTAAEVQDLSLPRHPAALRTGSSTQLTHAWDFGSKTMARSILSTLDNSDLYTVAWIAALPIERAAATAMLDERHNTPCDFVQHPSDTNSYTWGKMGEHNVVIASLPAGLYGIASAANTASNLLSSLPHIRVGLLVGIGGGISRPDQDRDIRLGDIVVSQPQGTTGGVIQYDLKKAIAGQKQDRKDFLSMPPQVLLQALGALQADHELEESMVPEFLSAMPRKSSRTANVTKKNDGYSHQGFENDRLFRSSYIHTGGHDCHGCDSTEEVERDKRDTADPEIHYGIIASGNTLVKDAATRDKIVEDVGEECICFEMEAAGLMNPFPCLVIRGICDYADSHKNDRWQRYASATAAAYGKELLSYVPVRGLQETRRALDVLKSMNQNIQSLHVLASDTREGLENLKSSGHFDAIQKWLSPSDTSTNLNEALKKRQEGTGSWFLECEPFQEWKTGKRHSLWLHGIPGCGKTILSATIIDHLNQTATAESSPVILDFFFNFTDTDKQSLNKLIRSLISQLYSRCPNSRVELDGLFSSHENGNRQPTEKAIYEVFSTMLNHVKTVQIVIDALDECVTRKDLLLWIEGLISLKHSGLHLLVTSRQEEEIESGLQKLIYDGGIIPIQQDLINGDIRTYVRQRLLNGRGFERWSSHLDVQRKIEIELMLKANGMFRWAACQLDVLQDCINIELLEKSLKSLPKTLEETYGRILAGISESHKEYAVRLLQFLTYSRRPLTIEEAVDVMAINLNRDPSFDPARRMPNPREIVRFCSSLASIVEREIVQRPWQTPHRVVVVAELQLAHFSVQQYLKSSGIQSSFPEYATEMGAAFQKEMHEMTARGLITRTCLAYLSHPDHQKSLDEIETEFPFLRCSARLWIDHAIATEREKVVEQSIMEFFLPQSQAFRVWLKLFDQRLFEDSKLNPLCYASLVGLQHTARLLLDAGADVNAQGGDYGNALQSASYKGHIEIVQLLLDANADINAQGGLHGNALQVASYRGHIELVQLFLDAGADINAQGGYYGNALQAALYRGHIELVQLFLDAGADINARGGNYGNALNALQAASSIGNTEIVQLLLAAGANVNPQGGYSPNALQAASNGGHIETVQLLLDAGADINAQGDYSNALQAASYRGHIEIVQLLLDAGADINAQGGDYGNALQVASNGGHIETVQLLLDAGADINAQGGRYGNAIQAAATEGHIETVQLLLDAGADINAQGGDYGNALQAASYRGYIETVQLLLDAGANINAQGGRYVNALQAASNGGHIETVQLLLDAGADINVQGGHYGNALQAASSGGYIEAVQLLLDAGADINAQGGDYGNALQAAANGGHIETVQLLLDAGADISAQGGYHGDALQAASINRHMDIVQLLRDAGAKYNYENEATYDSSFNC
ncbi:hypothetical protein N7490_009230 [Penicillium lividum]|nr:hypothetical protein N7490_009230 [Penicillium lividum]